MEKSKISRAEENKQSQCVEGCDWSDLAGDWMPACDWSSPRIPGQQRLNGGGSIQHSGVSYARPESARIGNILRFLTTLMQPPLMFASRHVLHRVLHERFLSRVIVYEQVSRCQGCYQVADWDPEYTSGDRAILPIAILLLQGEQAPDSDQNPF